MNQWSPYNPYASFQYPGFQPMPQPRQVEQVNGKESLDKIQLAPNSSVLVMDTTAPIVWLRVSDSAGNVTNTAYDITPHKDAPTHDMAGIEERLAALEAAVKKLTGGGVDE